MGNVPLPGSSLHYLSLRRQSKIEPRPQACTENLAKFGRVSGSDFRVRVFSLKYGSRIQRYAHAKI